MNTASVGRNVPEAATAETFKQDEFRLLIVANKFQTGFDGNHQPSTSTGPVG
jgi:type I restriction enzyme R subunit